MNKVQLQIQISAEAMDGLKTAAEKKGITPNILARLILNERFGQTDEESKSYTFTTRSWREIEAYAKVRNLGSVEGFVPVALDMAMSRNRLSPHQKAEFEKILGK
ncbi:MAG: hypothetical protein LBH20_01800 [Treponema sp.]|nr:hypothetical protein [Treponema sp.]